MINICPKCQINFDHLHQRCASANYTRYLQGKMDELWKVLGEAHKEIDRLEIKIEALQEENAELRLKKNGVEIDTVIGADDMLPPGLSADEVIDYQKNH